MDTAPPRMGLQRPARSVLTDAPDAVVRLRLLKEVLREPRQSQSVGAARRAVADGRRVRCLSAAQGADGGWGRFHSCDTRARPTMATTEFAVARAISLRLDGSHPVLRRAVAYLLRLLAGRVDFPDPPERNDSWPTGVSLFIAATLALIDPGCGALDDPRTLWAEILRRTFAGNRYDGAAERRAHRELTGRSGARPWLRLNNRYAVALLGARARELPSRVERAYTHWLWGLPAGLGYLGVPLGKPPQRVSAFVYDAWFTSHELLSAFPSWRTLARPVISWLYDQRTATGGWDFGPRWAGSACFPLSDSWRRRRARGHDWTTRVLCLLARGTPSGT